MIDLKRIRNNIKHRCTLPPNKTAELCDEIERLTLTTDEQHTTLRLIAKDYDKAKERIAKLEAVVDVAQRLVDDDDSYYNVTQPLEAVLEALEKSVLSEKWEEVKL